MSEYSPRRSSLKATHSTHQSSSSSPPRATRLLGNPHDTTTANSDHDEDEDSSILSHPIRQAHRASIGRATRVQLAASPAFRTTAVQQHSQSSTSSRVNTATSSPSYQFPPRSPASTSAASSPRLLNGPRMPTLNHSPGRAPAPAVNGSTGSIKRKPPPPLDFSANQSLSAPNPFAHGSNTSSSAGSSETDEQEIMTNAFITSNYTTAQRYAGQAASLVAAPRSSADEYAQWPSPPGHSAGKVSLGGAVANEDRDTLSDLHTFDIASAPSPYAGQPEPSAGSEPEADDETRQDDTRITRRSSLLSSSPSDTRQFSLVNSTGSNGAGRPYAGLGLGLPYSSSAAANLSAFAGPLSPPTRPMGETTGSLNSPGTGSRSRSASNQSIGGPESPVTDRSKLIGLGELATPRWTSGVLERRWGAPLDRRSSRDADDALPSTTRLDRDPMASRTFGSAGSSRADA